MGNSIFFRSRLSFNNKPISDDETLTLLKNASLQDAQIECLSNHKLLLKITFGNRLEAIFRGARGRLDCFEFVHAPLNFIVTYTIGKYFFPEHNIFPPAVIYRIPKEKINESVRMQNKYMCQSLRYFPAYGDSGLDYYGSLSLWIENSVIAAQHPFWKKEGAEKLMYPFNLNYEHLENPYDLSWTKEFIEEMVYFNAQMQLVRSGDFHAANWVITKDRNFPFQIDSQTILSFYDTQKERVDKYPYIRTNLRWGNAGNPRISAFPESLFEKLRHAFAKDRYYILNKLTHLDGNTFGLNRKDLRCLFRQWKKIKAKLYKFRKNKINPDTFFSLLKERRISFWHHDDNATPLYLIEGW